MRHERILGMLLCVLLLFSMALPASAAGGRITHGTADTWITEDMLVDTPPKDYAVNPKTQAKAKTGAYNAYFLKDDIQTVSIEIDENNLNYLLQNAIDEPYVMTQSVTIGDTTLGYCGLRTKGNYTLLHSYTDNPGSDRFSFTVNFGKYIKKEQYGEDQNFYGVSKISFNNFFFDKSMMKEFFALQLMEEMGLPTPQHGLAKLYINGAYYGVFAMIETMDFSILEQYFGVDGSHLSSYLCKPTQTNLIYSRIEADPAPLYEYSEKTYAEVENMLPTALEWVRRLNCLSSGTDFEENPLDVNSEEYLELLSQVMDIEEAVKYFAVHSWLCQMDNMFVERQNFALYLSPEGVCTLLPWDYDLSFGCFYPSTAQATANYPIDVMFRTDVWNNLDATCSRVYSTFPLFNVIYQNDTLMEQYHSYMRECSKIALLGGTVESTGKSYDPGYFNSFIETMEDSLAKAAAEPLAENVYYMNYTRQPQGINSALPNLSKIIALRSVGVLHQTDGKDITVCSSGCNLEALGNGIRGDTPTSGIMTVVDPVTGIFATAEFRGGYRSPAPALGTTPPAETVLTTVEELLRPGLLDELMVYQTKVFGNPQSGFTVTIPLAMEHLGDGYTYEFYTLTNGKLIPIEMTQDDNLFTGTAESIATLAVLVKPSAAVWLVPAAITLVLLLALAAGLLLHRRKNR